MHRNRTILALLFFANQHGSLSLQVLGILSTRALGSRSLRCTMFLVSRAPLLVVKRRIQLIGALDSNSPLAVHSVDQTSRALDRHPHWTLPVLECGNKPVGALDSRSHQIPHAWMITDQTSRALDRHPHWTLPVLECGNKPVGALDSRSHQIPHAWMITDQTSRALDGLIDLALRVFHCRPLTEPWTVAHFLTVLSSRGQIHRSSIESSGPSPTSGSAVDENRNLARLSSGQLPHSVFHSLLCRCRCVESNLPLP